MADATYIEPITWEVVREIIKKERPDAILPTMGGQTALNCALDLEKHGVLAEFGVEMIGATADAIDKAEDRPALTRQCAALAWSARVPASPTTWKRPGACNRWWASPASSALLHHGRLRRHRLQPGRVRRDSERGLDLSPTRSCSSTSR